MIVTGHPHNAKVGEIICISFSNHQSYEAIPTVERCTRLVGCLTSGQHQSGEI